MKVFRCCLIFILCFHGAFAFATGLKLQFHIYGISGPALQNVDSRLEELQKSLLKNVNPKTINTFYSQVPVNIQNAIAPFGYFHGSVRSKLIQYKTTITMLFFVTAGPPTYIKSSVITLIGPGKNNPILLTVLKKARDQLAINCQLNTVNYDKIKQLFYDQAETQGYLKGFFSTHTIIVNPKNNTAMIQLTFDTGPQYYFGAVYFSKNPLSTSFLQRYIPFRTGEPFSSEKLLTLQNNLAGTIYFSQVRVTSEIDNARNYYIPVDVKLVPTKAKKYSLGLGYGTDTGIRASLGWEWRRINNTGHYLQTLLQVSQKQNDNFQARYIIPGKNPVTDYWALTSGIFTNKIGNDDNDQYTTEQVGVNYVRFLNSWQRTLSLQLQPENFTVVSEDGITNTVIPGIAWERVSTANRVNVDNGYRIYINLQGGYVINDSNASFAQSEIQGKYILSSASLNNRLLFGADIGASLVNNFADMPLSQRFFAGGAQSLRGFSYQALGPGRYLALGSIEWQHRLCGNLYSALFYNAGNAVENFPFSAEQAIGFGAVYRSPVGPLEISLAHPLNQPFQLNQHGWVIQFSMGPDL